MGSLGANKALIVDGTTPTLVSQMINMSSLTLTYDETLGSTLPALGDYTVSVNGSPVALSAISILGTVVTLTLSSPVTDTDTVTLTYNPGATPVQDAVGNTAASFTGQSVTNVTIDVTPPTVVDVTSPHADGTFATGEVITLEIVFSESVNVTGIPQLTLETGATDAIAAYTSGSGTNTLTFTYTVAADDQTSLLDTVSNASLALNGGTISDASPNNAVLTLPVPGALHSLGSNKTIIIDAAGPAMTLQVYSDAAYLVPVADNAVLTTGVYYLKISANKALISDPLITIDAEGSANDLSAQNMTLLSGNDYGYTYIITSDPASVGLLLTDISLTASDLAGNTSTLVHPLNAAQKSFYIDTVVPSDPAIAPDLVVGSDTGTSSSDNYTNDTTPTFTGVCSNGDTVKLYSDGVATGDTVLCAAGTYSLTPTVPLSAASHLITITFIDVVLLESNPSPALAIIIDTTSPSAPGAPDMTLASDDGTSSIDDITSDTTPEFTLSCDIGMTVNLYDNVTLIAS